MHHRYKCCCPEFQKLIFKIGSSDPLCHFLPSRMFLEKNQMKEKVWTWSQKKMSRKKTTTTLRNCLLPLIHAVYPFWCLVAPTLCALNIFILFPNYLSAQKLLPIWSVINYCLLIRQPGDKSISV